MPSIRHYLVVEPSGPMVIHHRRSGDAIEAPIVSSGILDLTPPGLRLSVSDLFAEP